MPERSAIADVEFVSRPKWGMGAVAYSVRMVARPSGAFCKSAHAAFWAEIKRREDARKAAAEAAKRKKAEQEAAKKSTRRRKPSAFGNRSRHGALEVFPERIVPEEARSVGERAIVITVASFGSAPRARENIHHLARAGLRGVVQRPILRMT